MIHEYFYIPYNSDEWPIILIDDGGCIYDCESSCTDPTIDNQTDCENEGEVWIEERNMIEARVVTADPGATQIVHEALNEVAIGRREVAGLSMIGVTVDDEPLTTYRADAVIVSTATGSTGYSYSAGGPILHPESNEIILQPVAPHTGLRDSIVLPRNSKVTLRPIKNDITIVSADGDSEIQLNVGDKLVIKSGIYSAKFLRSLSTVSFYNTLANKLGLFNKS